MLPSLLSARTVPPPQARPYGKQQQRTQQLYGKDSYEWLLNPDVVLAPHPVGSAWKDVMYWLSGSVFLPLVITVAVLTRDERNDNEPGPGFFQFLSHWLYIWFTVNFFIWGASRFSRLARRISFELVFFNFGTVVVWTVMTTLLVMGMTTESIEHKLPDSDDSPVGLYVILVVVLHYWSIIVFLWWLSQYGEMVAIFWVKRLAWITAYVGLVFNWFILMIEVFSPLILWIIYLALFDPFDVYGVTPDFASNYHIAYLVLLSTLVVGQIILGWYLHYKARRLIAGYVDQYDSKTFPLN